jgi:hypothetical protein
MSSALAIAAVTHVLKDLLNDGIIQSDLSATLGSKVAVTARPPVREPGTSTGNESQLNLFLYQVQPNPGWRNQGLPSRAPGGERVGRPPLALDLYYLLTAYDERDLHPEILLGYATQLLHETPMLGRKAIRRSLTDLPDSPNTLPDNLKALTKSGLADQLEAIKITPLYPNVEEMSKLWTGFQAPYRPSTAYLITVVLIESSEAARSALPVLTLGLADRGPLVQASLLPPYPTLLAVRAPNYQPVARTGETIHLLGHHLAGASPEVVLKHPGFNLELKVPAAGLEFTSPPSRADLSAGTESFDLPEEVLQLADRRIRINLNQASPTANWSPGHYLVELRVLRPGDTAARTSNALPLPIAPVILFGGANGPVITAAASANNVRATTVRLKCQPDVRKGQTVSLILGDRELAGAPLFAGVATTTDTLEFKDDLPDAMFVRVGDPPAPPRQPIRLRVDGVESLFIKRFLAPKPPKFDATQLVTMP